jgi:hypothetical protein
VSGHQHLPISSCSTKHFVTNRQSHYFSTSGSRTDAFTSTNLTRLSNIVESVSARSGFMRTENVWQSTSANPALSMDVFSLLSCITMSTQALCWTDPHAGSRTHPLNKNFERTPEIYGNFSIACVLHIACIKGKLCSDNGSVGKLISLSDDR